MGDSTSPAYGDLTFYHFVQSVIGSKEERRGIWGEALVDIQDINKVFLEYVKVTVPFLPWCESSLQPETNVILNPLVKLNSAGFCTINSQPSANGLPSDHEIFGWGGPGGCVYQRAYVEMFTSPTNLKYLMAEASKKPSLSFFAVDSQGNTYSNGLKKAVALTWGVFPDKEILQPTIFDPETFLVWKDEAFGLWLSRWASIYDDETKSSELIHEIHDTYFLVALIDNDYIADKYIWECFDNIIDGPLTPSPSH